MTEGPRARITGVIYLLYFFKSTFLPRILGALMVIAGLGWLTFLSPPFANSVLTPIEVLGFLAESALMLWLLVRGVNVQRWDEKAGAAAITTQR